MTHSARAGMHQHQTPLAACRRALQALQSSDPRQRHRGGLCMGPARRLEAQRSKVHQDVFSVGPLPPERGRSKDGIADLEPLHAVSNAFHDARHGALTNLAAAGVSPMAIMGSAGHRSMATTRQYVHLAGVVFRDEAVLLEQRLLGVEDPGRNSLVTASLSEDD